MNVSKGPEFREIIDRLREKARRKVPDSDAEDLVQEVLVVLVERMQRDQPIDSVQAYADGVLRHVIYDYYQRKRELLLPTEAGLEQTAPTPTPEQRVVWMRHLRVIEQLAEENRIDQSLVNEHFVGGSPLREVATQLDVSPGVVNGRLYRFRQKLMKHAGSCFAWIFAILTGLWHRIARASTLSRVPQTALSGAGLLAAGSLIAWMWWGHTTPSTPENTYLSAAHTITASSHASLHRHLKASARRKARRVLHQRLTLQWKHNTPSSQSSPLKQQAPGQFTLLAPQAQTLQAQARELSQLQARMAALTSPGSSRTSGALNTLSYAHVPRAGVQRAALHVAPVYAQQAQASITHQHTNRAADLLPTSLTQGQQGQDIQPALAQARAESHQPTMPRGAAALAVFAQAPTPAARPAQTAPPSTAPQAPQPSAKPTWQTPQPTTPTPSVPTTPTSPARPGKATSHTGIARNLGVLAAQNPLHLAGVQDPIQSLPSVRQANPFAANARRSFCMVQDGRIYRCDGGMMKDISGPSNTSFGCQDPQCRGMIGDGPSLVLTAKGDIYIVGSGHFRRSLDNGLTWTVPKQTLTSAQLLSQSHLILNQQGGLWQYQKTAWQQVRSKQPHVHEVRLHLEQGRLQIEDDTGFQFKLDWKSTTVASPSLSKQLSNQIDVQKMSPMVNHKAPSITGEKPQNSTPLPEQKDTPIRANP